MSVKMALGNSSLKKHLKWLGIFLEGSLMWNMQILYKLILQFSLKNKADY